VIVLAAPRQQYQSYRIVIALHCIVISMVVALSFYGMFDYCTFFSRSSSDTHLSRESTGQTLLVFHYSCCNLCPAPLEIIISIIALLISPFQAGVRSGKSAALLAVKHMI